MTGPDTAPAGRGLTADQVGPLIAKRIARGGTR